MARLEAFRVSPCMVLYTNRGLSRHANGHGRLESQDSSSEAYLYDSKTGRQVTPKIVPRKRDATAGIVGSGPAIKPKGGRWKDESSMTIEEKVDEATRRFVQRRKEQENLDD